MEIHRSGLYYEPKGACNFPPDNHVSTISKDPTKNQMVIGNFYNDGVNINATISGNNFTFSEVSGGVGYIGSGYVIDGTITIDFFACEDYNYPDECDEVNCSLNYAK